MLTCLMVVVSDPFEKTFEVYTQKQVRDLQSERGIQLRTFPFWTIIHIHYFPSSDQQSVCWVPMVIFRDNSVISNHHYKFRSESVRSWFLNVLAEASKMISSGGSKKMDYVKIQIIKMRDSTLLSTIRGMVWTFQEIIIGEFREICH